MATKGPWIMPDNVLSIVQMLTDERPRGKWHGELTSGRNMQTWPLPQPLSGQVPLCRSGLKAGGQAHTQSCEASEGSPGHTGRKLQW